MATYHRKYFGLRKEVAPLLEATYASKLVDLLRTKGCQVTRGDLTVKLAREFGFCVGVERAVQMAYETREKFPNKRIFITAEIIHNAFVNRKLVELGFIFLTGKYAGGLTYNDITADDVVILPAFGAAVSEIRGKKAARAAPMLALAALIRCSAASTSGRCKRISDERPGEGSAGSLTPPRSAGRRAAGRGDPDRRVRAFSSKRGLSKGTL